MVPEGTSQEGQAGDTNPWAGPSVPWSSQPSLQASDSQLSRLFQGPPGSQMGLRCTTGAQTHMETAAPSRA